MMSRQIKPSTLWWTVFLCPALLAFLCGSGCSSSDQQPVYPVSGAVFVRSKPADGARVVLRPAGEINPDEWPAGYPRGTVQSDGSFQITTFEPGDGAPQGRYVVLVEWKPPLAEGTDPETASQDRLRGRYVDPDKSILRAEVQAAPTKLPRIDLE
jgi:hypothetical protein